MTDNASVMRHALASDGVSLAWREAGGSVAAPTLLVHGFGSHHRLNWLSAGWGQSARRLMLVDLRGHGESERPRGAPAYALDRMAQDLIDLLDAEGIAEATAVGYSLGAMILLALASRAPQRLRAMVLGGVGGNLFHPGRAQRGTRIAEALRTAQVPNEAAEIALYRRFVATHNPPEAVPALADAFEAAARHTFRPQDLAAIPTPTLVIAGERDSQAGSPQDLAATLPNAEATTAPRRDHMTFVGDPTFRRAAEAFLAQHDAAEPTSSSKD